MQVLEETGRRAARQAGIPWDRDRFYSDKAYNEQIGTAELYRLSQKYAGDEVLTAAAYNAGEGNVDKWMKRFGDPRKGQISDEEFAKAIPFKETRDYVANTAKAQVEVTFKNLPAGATVKQATAPGVDVALNVHRSLEGAP
jgi:soluble lytic murein transglycosylase-like protein